MTVSCFVVMGVTGSGKTTVGQAVAKRLGASFIDGDDLHPPANIEKMSRGEPLTDTDRAPWLRLVGQALSQAEGPCVIGCSALKRRYRDIIRTEAGAPVMFLHLTGSRDVLAERVANRPGHFMPASLLDSQIASLEPPGDGELFKAADIDQPVAEIVDGLLAGLGPDA
ncbi:MAG: gluconokinase [Pseudomonadota bacterium]